MNQAATIDSAEALFDGVRDYIKDAREIMDRGEYIELEGLDGRVAELCDAIIALPQEQASNYVAELEVLMGELNHLKDTFEEGKAKLAGEIGGVSQHQQASGAYNNATVMAAKASASAPVPDGEDE